MYEATMKGVGAGMGPATVGGLMTATTALTQQAAAANNYERCMFVRGWQKEAVQGSAAPATAVSTSAQVRFMNQISIPLQFYIDGHFVCTATPNADCSASVPKGSHKLEAGDSSGRKIERSINLTDQPYTWRIVPRANQ